MPLPKYIVRLSDEDALEDLHTGRIGQRLIHAHFAQSGYRPWRSSWDDARIAEAVECGASTVYRVRQALGGLQQHCSAEPTGRLYRSWTGAEAQLIPWPVPPVRADPLDDAPAGGPPGGVAVVESIRVCADQKRTQPWLQKQW